MGYKVESDFNHCGLRCVVIALDRGHRCGYVGVDRNHPLYGKSYSENISVKESVINREFNGDKVGVINLFCSKFSDIKNNTIELVLAFDVHGGITYSDGKDEYPVISNLWWFGFDCAHYNDAPDFSIMRDDLKDFERKYPNPGIVRTNEYVTKECMSLAEQLSAFKGDASE